MVNIKPKGHQSQTFLDYLARKAVNFLSMKKKLARPGWLMSVIASSIVGGNVAIVEPQLAIFWLGVGVTQVHLAFPDGFNLRTLQDDSCLKAFLDMVVVISFAINGYHAGTFRHTEILAPGHRASNLRGTY
jgi:hypothetical protein